MSEKPQVYILRGEGIECEKESFRFFKSFLGEAAVHYLWVQELIKNKNKFLEQMRKNDFFFIPGGFSYSDHLGSGRLLAFRLSEINLWNELIEREVHIVGVCNGFQILVAAGLLGKKTTLKKNHSLLNFGNFTNQWVSLEAPLFERQDYSFSIRHAEGNLQYEDEENLAVFLKYRECFSNGSKDGAAGLVKKHQNSFVWGMMPHPEIAWREVNEANRSSSDVLIRFKKKRFTEKGAAFNFFEELFKKSQDGSF